MIRRAFLFLSLFALPFILHAQIRSYEVTDRTELHTSSPYDLAWDGKKLWLSHDEGLISAIHPQTGKVLERIDTEMSELRGLAYDGKDLWAAETDSARLHQLEPNSGRTRESHPSPAEGPSRPNGLAWDGEQIWNNDTRTVYCGTDSEDATYHFDPDSKEKKRFKGAQDCPFGAAFGGGYLWVGENSEQRIYMLDTSNGAILDSIAAPAPFVNGLAYGNGGLWMSSNGEGKGKLYRIELELEDEPLATEDAVKAHTKTSFFYPNPAESFVQIDLPKQAPKGEKQVALYGPNGKRILVRSLSGSKQRLELPELSAGIHYLRILNDGKEWRSKPLLIAQ